MRDVEILRAACCIAGLDTDISEREERLLRKLAERAGVGNASLTAMMARATRDRNFYREMFRSLKMEADTTIKTLLCVAVADHDLTTDERVILHHFAEKMGLDDQRFEQLIDAAKKYVAEKNAE